MTEITTIERKRYPPLTSNGTEIASSSTALPAHYKPEIGLRTIAVAEAGEKHWARAKDPTKLFIAIEAKIKAQADYIVWRDSNARPAHRPKNSCRAERVLPEGDPGDVTACRWRKRLCSTSNGSTAPDPDKIDAVMVEARLRCRRICEQQAVYGTVRGTEGTGEFERYTPARYVEAVREVLGEIDLDPASSAIAQRTVKAERFFTDRDNGLIKEWHGRVFLNAPYNRDLLPMFVSKLVAEVAEGHTTEAILLVNNGTDTDWFDAALRACRSVCFTHGRIRFIEASGVEMSTPTQGQAFLYFGAQPDRFEAVFHHIGSCLRPSKHYDEDAA
jgi:ParB family chromosome partitioning protein